MHRTMNIKIKDMTKPIVAFRNYAKVRKNSFHTSQRTQSISIRNMKMFNNVKRL